MFRAILSLHIDMKQWDDAFAMKTLHPELDIDVYSPYAQWLVTQAQYEKARQAYKQAGNHESSMHLLGQLLRNAVSLSFVYS
jgi:intraflagellar transport protein 122